jgi:hypothetical protein
LCKLRFKTSDRDPNERKPKVLQGLPADAAKTSPEESKLGKKDFQARKPILIIY